MRKAPVRLAIGEEVLASVSAHRTVNATGVCFVAGEVYCLTADGWWVDWYLPADPDGVLYLSPLLHLLRPALRDPDAAWYALLGMVVGHRERHEFVIGRAATVTARLVGELLCCANDVPGFYWNNLGSVCLRIQRIA
jgi:hypothetical protein